MAGSQPKPSAAGYRLGGAAARWMRILSRPQNRGLALTALVVAAAVVLARYGWNRFGPSATHPQAGTRPEYLVTPERMHVTPPPAWIHSDVKAEVVRSADLSRLDLRDRKLVEKIASAFALHPWVAKVVRVEKRYPAGVNVELRYRRPVAVVEGSWRGRPELLFIDENAVLLPSADFAPSQAKDYLRVADGNETPAGYGLPWGSERIAAAARLAAVWGNRWQPLGLYRIVAAPADRPEASARDLPFHRSAAANTWLWELRTRRDMRVIWGTSPGAESPAEPSPDQKIAALERYVQATGPLDRDGGPVVIDLRELARKGNESNPSASGQKHHD